MDSEASSTNDETTPTTLDQIREALGDCTRCKLHQGRTTLVFGVGHPDADLMFVGEAPGRDEDRQGEPFVGRAGQLLTKIIESVGLTRDQVYI
ncbi:MAG TPA: uracil-DNA glycosylase, partial [Acidobacteria bacterium]|nr:uracil-DNA glycosylase [Acidobacteriota bacterium]